MSLPVALLLVQLMLQLLLVGLALRWAWQQDRRDARLVERCTIVPPPPRCVIRTARLDLTAGHLVTANDVEPPPEAK